VVAVPWALYAGATDTTSPNYYHRLYTEDMSLVGQVNPGDVFPPGQLHIDSRSVGDYAPRDRRAWLIVKLDKPNAAGELSYSARTRVDCTTGTTAVLAEMWTKTPDAWGPSTRHHTLPQVALINEPSATLRKAATAICELKIAAS
jgi:hypothetical protein